MLKLFKREKKTNSSGKEDLPEPVAKFLEEYETEEQKLTVLIKEYSKGGRVQGDFLFPVVSFLAYIEGESGGAVREKGTLCWFMRRSSNNYIHCFKDYGIYTVLVRKMKPGILNPVGAPFKNWYYLVKIIKKNIREPQLEKIREEYLKPVSIKDDLGVFWLDRKYGWFEGEINWLGKTKSVLLDKDKDSDTAEAAFKTLYMLLADAEKWDKKIREYAAAELTCLANDWQDSEDASEIKEEEFSERIGGLSFHIDDEGSFEADFDDDDMFCGHWIVVCGNSDGELMSADIEG